MARHLKIESLENRLNPVGSFTSSLVGTTLTLTGTDNAESIAILDTGVGVTITGQNGTTIDGLGSKPFTVAVNLIRVIARGGDDAVALDPTNPISLSGGLDLNLGDSSPTTGNQFNLVAGNIVTLGSVTLRGGSGRDTAQFFTNVGTIQGDFVADFGNGTSELTINANTEIKGKLNVRGGFGPDTLTLDAAIVRKNVTFSPGDGDSTLNIYASTNIDGNVIINGGRGTDNISLQGVSVSGPGGFRVNGGIGSIFFDVGVLPAFISKGVHLQSTDSVAKLGVTSTLDNGGPLNIAGREVSVILNGNLNAQSASITGVSGVAIDAVASSININRGMLVRSTTSTAEFLLDGGQLTIGGSLTVSALDNANINWSSNAGVGISGNLVVTSSNQSAIMDQSSGPLNLTGTLNVRGRNGAEANIFNATLSNNVTVQGGADFTRLVARGTTTFSRNINVIGGSGPTTVDVDSLTAVINGNLSVTSGISDDNISLRGLIINGTTTIRTNGGSDTINLDSGVRLNGVTLIDTGAGDDFLNFAQSTGLSFTAVSFNARTTIRAGAGNDTLLMGRALSAGGDAQSRAAFSTAPAIVDGGLNLNSFDPEISQFTGTPSIENWTDPTTVS